jgi:tape measure domain-containing protein
MAETNEFFIKIGADVDDAMSKLNMLSGKLSSFASNTQRSGSQISGSMIDTSKVFSAAFSSMGLALTTAGIVSGIIGIGKAALTTAAEIEQITVSFEVFTGSAQTAKDMLAALKAQALASPMQFQDITKGAQTLLQYGLTAQQVVPITRVLGDISGGNSDKFQRLALAFGQVNAAGRLMGQEARQMVNAGFNPLKAISDSTGESMATLTKRMHDGQISVKEVADAFISATSEGGQFYGMTEKQSQTLQGQFNKLSESVTFALAEIGESLAKSFDLGSVVPAITSFMNDFMSAMKNNKDMAIVFDFVINNLKITLGILKAILIGLINAWQGLVFVYASVLKAGAPILNFFGNIISKAYEYVKGIRFVGAALEWLIGKFTKIDNATPDLTPPKIDESKPEGFAEKPSKESAKSGTKKEKVEVIAGTDFITKEEGNKIKRLIQLNKDAAKEIEQIQLTGTDQKLAKLKADYEIEIQDYVKYQVDYTNITAKYEATRKKIIDDAATERQANAIRSLQEELQGLMTSYPKNIEDFAKDMLNNDVLNSLKNYGEAFYAASKDMAVNIASGFAEIVGSALVSGGSVGDAFRALGSLILGSLGDYLIKIGTAAIAAGVVGTILKAFFTGGAATVPELGIAGGMAAVAVGSAMKALAGKVNASMDSNKANSANKSVSSSNVSDRTSGSSYQYGGSSYSTQTVKLLVDLTGSITATPTGYQINKTLETNLRITGR